MFDGTTVTHVDETTRTLFCGDLLGQVGDGPAIVEDGDIVAGAMAAEDMFGATALTPSTASTIRRLADLAPRTLAVMHGSAYGGDGKRAIGDLALAMREILGAPMEPMPVAA